MQNQINSDSQLKSIKLYCYDKLQSTNKTAIEIFNNKFNADKKTKHNIENKGNLTSISIKNINADLFDLDMLEMNKSIANKKNKLLPSLCVIAKTQSDGRGQRIKNITENSTDELYKNWSSNDGGLYLSIIYKDSIDNLSKHIVYIICNFLHINYLNFKPSIKFANDILIQKKKIAGVLIQASHGLDTDYACIGIGINIFNNPLKDQNISTCLADHNLKLNNLKKLKNQQFIFIKKFAKDLILQISKYFLYANEKSQLNHNFLHKNIDKKIVKYLPKSKQTIYSIDTYRNDLILKWGFLDKSFEPENQSNFYKKVSLNNNTKNSKLFRQSSHFKNLSQFYYIFQRPNFNASLFNFQMCYLEIGNSSCKFILSDFFSTNTNSTYDNDKFSKIYRFSYEDIKNNDFLLKDFLKKHILTNKYHPNVVYFVSVNSNNLLFITNIIKKKLKISLIEIKKTTFRLKPNNYPLDQLGIDRICFLESILSSAANLSNPEDNSFFIAISFGTAITFECVCLNGTYLGGAILPSAYLLNKSMQDIALSKIDNFKLQDHETLAQDTTSSIKFGINALVLGGLDRLMFQSYQKLHKNYQFTKKVFLSSQNYAQSCKNNQHLINYDLIKKHLQESYINIWHKTHKKLANNHKNKNDLTFDDNFFKLDVNINHHCVYGLDILLSCS